MESYKVTYFQSGCLYGAATYHGEYMYISLLHFHISLPTLINRKAENVHMFNRSLAYFDAQLLDTPNSKLRSTFAPS